MGVELPRAEEPGSRLPSDPVALGVPSERAGELGIALATADGALDEIDAASPERREILETRPGEEDGGAGECGGQPHADPPGLRR